jgi:hypothetical protein
VELVPNPAQTLAAAPGLIATADSAILDRCGRWLNLARGVVDALVPAAFVLDLSIAP